MNITIVDELEHIGECAELAALAALDANSEEETLEVIASFLEDTKLSLETLKAKVK